MKRIILLAFILIGILCMAEFASLDSSEPNISLSATKSSYGLSGLTNPDNILSGTTRGVQNLGSPNVYSDGGNNQIIVADTLPRVLMGNQSTFGEGFYVSKAGVNATTNTDPAQWIFNSNQDVFKIAASGTVNMDQITAPVDTGVGRVTITHNLGVVPVVIAIYAQTSIPNNYNLWADNSGAVTTGGGVVQFKSFHVRTITATSTSVTFEEDFYWGGFPAAATAGPYTIKYYLLQETAN